MIQNFPYSVKLHTGYVTLRRQKHKRETCRLVAKYMGTARGGRGSRGHDRCFAKKSTTQFKRGGGYFQL